MKCRKAYGIMPVGENDRSAHVAQQKAPEVATPGLFYSVLGGWLNPKAGYQLFFSVQPFADVVGKTRPKQLSFRVSEEEYQQLQEKISESGKNQQEYILSCVLEKQIVNTDGIKELIPELKRIGNNLNQIAKRCNEGGMLPSEAEVRKHGEELNKVWQSLRRYLQRRA